MNGIMAYRSVSNIGGKRANHGEERPGDITVATRIDDRVCRFVDSRRRLAGRRRGVERIRGAVGSNGLDLFLGLFTWLSNAL